MVIDLEQRDVLRISRRIKRIAREREAIDRPDIHIQNIGFSIPDIRERVSGPFIRTLTELLSAVTVPGDVAYRLPVTDVLGRRQHARSIPLSAGRNTPQRPLREFRAGKYKLQEQVIAFSIDFLL
jgi:hypothetical protein